MHIEPNSLNIYQSEKIKVQRKFWRKRKHFQVPCFAVNYTKWKESDETVTPCVFFTTR